ncbi:MAG: preprotein translocase subunit SecG [Rickettsiales bacterium]|jgi:preprotein translocase subunit SecG|nr:preprotein translocase subunit SecG [Rickettsiales bacterium]
MINVLLVLNIVVVILLIGIVLLQKSQGGVLGMGGGSKNALLTTHSAGNLVTKITYTLAAAFFAICIALAILVAKRNGENVSFIEAMSKKSGGKPVREIDIPGVNKIPEAKVEAELKLEEDKLAPAARPSAPPRPVPLPKLPSRPKAPVKP